MLEKRKLMSHGEAVEDNSQELDSGAKLVSKTNFTLTFDFSQIT